MINQKSYTRKLPRREAKKTTKLSVKEKDVENQILHYLKIIGVFAWKNQSVGIFDAKKGLFRKSNNPYHIRGVSDILGVYKGRMLAIEVKTEKTVRKTSPHQKMFIDKVNAQGGIGFVAYSVDCVMKGLGMTVSKGGLESEDEVPLVTKSSDTHGP